MYLGNSDAISLAQGTTLALKLVPIRAISQVKLTKGAGLAGRSVLLSRKRERIPNIFAIYEFGYRCAGDSGEAEHNRYEREKEDLPVDTLGFLKVICTISNFSCHRYLIQTVSQYLLDIRVELRGRDIRRPDMVVKGHFLATCHR